VRATTFARNFTHYQDEAICIKAVFMTSHDRNVGGYMSSGEFEPRERLKARERQVLLVGALSDDIVADIEAAEYGAEAKQGD
jgi:hypothetical protein